MLKLRKIKVSDKKYFANRPDNTRAIKAYEKCGFKKAGIKKYPKNKYLPQTLKMVQ